MSALAKTADGMGCRISGSLKRMGNRLKKAETGFEKQPALRLPQCAGCFFRQPFISCRPSENGLGFPFPTAARVYARLLRQPFQFGHFLVGQGDFGGLGGIGNVVRFGCAD